MSQNPNRDKFINRSNQERRALKEFLAKILVENDNVSYSIYHTPNHDKSKYDCLIRQYRKSDGVMLKKMFFEVKIRGAYYDTLLIEKQKFESMKKLIRDLDTDKIYYVNFTPKNTIVFDLLKIEADNKLVYLNHSHNKKTIAKEEGKVLKEVAYISIADGKIFDYVFNQETETEKVEIDEDFEMFKKDDDTPEKAEEVEVSNQIQLDIPAVVTRTIRKDDNGQVLYDSFEEFQSFPLKTRYLCVAQRRINLWLKPGEDRLEMIEKLGGEIELGQFLYKRSLDEYFNKPTGFKQSRDEIVSLTKFFNDNQ